MNITYTSTFLNYLNKFRNTSTYCDVKLKCEEKVWSCHRCVLASACPLIHTLLDKQLYSENMVIILPPCFKEILDTLLDMLYTGHFNILLNNVELVYKFSVYCEISILQKICLKFLNDAKKLNNKMIQEIDNEIKKLPSLKLSNLRTIKSRRKKLNKDFVYFNDEDEKEIAKDTEFTPNINESGKEFSNLTQVASEAYEDLKTNKQPNNHLLCTSSNTDSSLSKNGVLVKDDGEKLLRKIKKNGKHQCPRCNKLFPRKATMELHIKRSHTKVKTFKCPDCSKAFYLNRELQAHVRIHTDGHAFKCEECDKTFTTNEGFKRHSLHVHEPSIHQCINEGCDFTCSAPVQLDRHRLKCSHGTQEPQIKQHKCHICHATFRWPHVMRRHVSSVHMRQKPYKCDTCNMAFNRKEQLREHTASHTHEKSYKCKICGKSFRQQSGLCVHKKVHQNIDKIVCEICGHNCRSVSALKVHLEVHLTERPFTCDECNKTFKSNRQLKSHIKSQHQKSNSSDKTQQKSLPTKANEQISQPCSSEPLLQPLQLVVATPDNFFTQFQPNNIPLLQCLNPDDGNISAYFNNVQPQFTQVNENTNT